MSADEVEAWNRDSLAGEIERRHTRRFLDTIDELVEQIEGDEPAPLSPGIGDAGSAEYATPVEPEPEPHAELPQDDGEDWPEPLTAADGDELSFEADGMRSWDGASLEEYLGRTGELDGAEASWDGASLEEYLTPPGLAGAIAGRAAASGSDADTADPDEALPDLDDADLELDGELELDVDEPRDDTDLELDAELELDPIDEGGARDAAGGDDGSPSPGDDTDAELEFDDTDADLEIGEAIAQDGARSGDGAGEPSSPSVYDRDTADDEPARVTEDEPPAPGVEVDGPHGGPRSDLAAALDVDTAGYLLDEEPPTVDGGGSAAGDGEAYADLDLEPLVDEGAAAIAAPPEESGEGMPLDISSSFAAVQALPDDELPPWLEAPAPVATGEVPELTADGEADEMADLDDEIPANASLATLIATGGSVDDDEVDLSEALELDAEDGTPPAPPAPGPRSSRALSDRDDTPTIVERARGKSEETT